MRDDFPTPVKEELARRVGYLCSNPGCRQLTSGPQDGPTGAVNIGVAAHITAASPGGPRYNPNMTAGDRASAANGIWLCQNCAKLIDSDEDRYSETKLGEWRSDNEQSAAQRLEQRGAITSDDDGVFLEAQRLMPDLIDEMRKDVRGDGSELTREFVVLPTPTIGYGWPRDHFIYTEDEHPTLAAQLAWLEEAGLIVGISHDPGFAYRMVPVFFRWLRAG